MSTEENKVTEVQLLTEEQINLLPAEIKKNVIFLTKKLDSKALVKLNPIVKDLLDMRELEKDLILMPMNKDGDFNVDNIKEYMSLKTSVGSFNSKLKSSAKELKEPYAKVQKGIIAVEKTLLAEAAKIKESIVERFSLYEADKIKKAKEAKEKRDKKLLDKIKKEEEEKEEAQATLKKSTVYNTVKYEIVNKKFTEDVSEAVLNDNALSLKMKLRVLESSTYDKVILDNDVTVLDIEVQAELQEYYISSKAKGIASIKARLEAISLENKNLVLETKNETIKEVHNETREFNHVPTGGGFQKSAKPTTPAPPRFETIEACIKNIEFNDFDSDGKLLNDDVAWNTLKLLIQNK